VNPSAKETIYLVISVRGNLSFYYLHIIENNLVFTYEREFQDGSLVLKPSELDDFIILVCEKTVKL